MYNLYENIYALCSERHITPGGLCGELGFRRSVLSDLKSGRKKSLDTTTLIKIANYFGVSVDSLLHGTETEKAPTQEGERATSEEDLKLQVAAFWGGGEDLSKEELDGLWSDAEGFYKFKLEQLKKSRSKQ